MPAAPLSRSVNDGSSRNRRTDWFASRLDSFSHNHRQRCADQRLWIQIIAPTHGGMARLSWPGWPVTYRDAADGEWSLQKRPTLTPVSWFSWSINMNNVYFKNVRLCRLHDEIKFIYFSGPEFCWSLHRVWARNVSLISLYDQRTASDNGAFARNRVYTQYTTNSEYFVPSWGR